METEEGQKDKGVIDVRRDISVHLNILGRKNRHPNDYVWEDWLT